MKRFFFIFTILIFALRLSAQTNAPIRLALISETDEAAAASDILTAQLSGNSKIHLLERDEIEKVYREQGLSAGNKDYLKLGQILGADGLLFFNIVRTPQATNLTARLVAVKPGVILTDGSFPWPLKDIVQWSESAVAYLDSFLPKLSLLVKDAIPISVVNLRSAVQSTEAAETERQLKLLTIQRLSREKQFFVLERQKMQLLGEEKELKFDDSAFWNGSYLLDGVVDQNGYSKETLTINARLTPPKGGVPMLIEVSGNRTNLSEVINQLVVKVDDVLKINSAVKEWNAADEARQYFDEAKWALKWGVFSEAQAAADSAWALGKNDLDCAIIRVNSYMLEISINVGKYESEEQTYVPGGYDANGNPVGPPPSEAEVQSDIRKMAAQHPWGMAYKETQDDAQKAKTVRYVFAGGPPDPKNIDRALHALELYYEFSRTSPDGEPKILWRGVGWDDWHNSDWYNLGIEDLIAASRALQDFNLAPFELQKPVAEKLADLRALARSVADFISKPPSVHDSYFVGDRITTHDELANTIGEDNPKNSNIFSCEVKWGCFWQETPEDCLALYRELMSSPVFCYIHNKFWFRELPSSRLVAWNEEDQKNIPKVWNNFIQELNSSTNVLLQMEAKALTMADAQNKEQSQSASNDLFEIIRSNHAELVANNVELFYFGWDLGFLNPELDDMDREYQLKTIPAQKTIAAFEKQKQYLKENKPYDFLEFVNTFREKKYSKSMALEIQPLIIAYKSNLVVQSQNASGMQKGQLIGAIAQVGFLEDNVNRILNPPAPIPRQKAQIQVPKPATVVVAATQAANTSEILTNIILVKKFLKIPLDGLIQLSGLETINRSRVTITAHHWLEGQLLLNFEYFFEGDQYFVNGSAIAILDPATEHWDVVSCPETDIQTKNNFYHRCTLWHGELFNCDGGQIKRYDFINRQWNVLPISNGVNYELFAVNGHLYAASRDIIFEILDGGKSTRILASTRRNPPASALDREDLGTPTLFEGPNHSLRVCTASKIFTWTGNNWREDSISPPASSPPEIFMDGVLFRRDGFLEASYQNSVLFRRENGTYGVLLSQDEISYLANETNVARLCLKGDHDNWRNFSRLDAKAVQDPKPFWKIPANLLPNVRAALRQSDLYILEDNFAAHTIINDRHEILQEEATEQNKYNAVLLCFFSDFPLPQKIFLKFDAPDVKTFTWMFPTTNLLFFSDNSAGIWIVPTSQIDSVIAGQKLQLIAEQQKAVAKASEEKKLDEQRRKAFLLKYDLNHNGTIDPDEQEAAMDDPYFIKYRLEQIHAQRQQ